MNETSNETVVLPLVENAADYWTLVVCFSLILAVSVGWLLSTVGGIGTIKDLLCDLACQTACDGWRNVDYVTEAAKFFTYWTILPWFTVTFTVMGTVDGITGICALTQNHRPTLQAAMVMTIVFYIVGMLLLWFFSCLSCLYSLCRCCCEKVVEEATELAKDPSLPPTESADEKVEHNYCCNFFSHFAIPMIIYFVLFSLVLSRGWQYAY